MCEIKPKRMLVVLAHPDDESFAAGGMLAKYAHQDVQIVLLCATRGEAGIPGAEPEKAGDILASDCAVNVKRYSQSACHNLASIASCNEYGTAERAFCSWVFHYQWAENVKINRQCGQSSKAC